MSLKKYKFIYIIVLMLIFSLITAGCQTAGRQTPPGTTPRNTRYVPPGTPPATPAPVPTTPGPGNPSNVPAVPSSLNTRASNIANAVSKINGVDKTTVVISGNNALVGIRQNENGSTGDVDNLKNNIVSTVKRTDKGIKNVYVTSDMSLYNRIDRIARDITEGKTLTNYTDEIDDIIRKIGSK